MMIGYYSPKGAQVTGSFYYTVPGSDRCQEVTYVRDENAEHSYGWEDAYEVGPVDQFHHFGQPSSSMHGNDLPIYQDWQ